MGKMNDCMVQEILYVNIIQLNQSDFSIFDEVLVELAS